MVVTLEIKNVQDLAILEQLAERLGWSLNPKSNESTDRLFKNAANKKFLLDQIEYVENGGEVMSVKLNDLKSELSK
jgi:predicted ATPase